MSSLLRTYLFINVCVPALFQMNKSQKIIEKNNICIKITDTDLKNVWILHQYLLVETCIEYFYFWYLQSSHMRYFYLSNIFMDDFHFYQSKIFNPISLLLLRCDCWVLLHHLGWLSCSVCRQLCTVTRLTAGGWL